MKRYDHTKIEKKWQKDWAKKGLYKTRDEVPGKVWELALIALLVTK
jgi:leucyl-tRNA synthetase